MVTKQVMKRGESRQRLLSHLKITRHLPYCLYQKGKLVAQALNKQDLDAIVDARVRAAGEGWEVKQLDLTFND